MSDTEKDKLDHELALVGASKPLPDPRALKRAMLKLDCVFLPALTLVWFLNFLDVSSHPTRS